MSDKQEQADILMSVIFKDKTLLKKEVAIRKDLARKIIKNTYHRGPAVEQWHRLVDQAAKIYSANTPSYYGFSLEVRSYAAKEMADFFEDDVKKSSPKSLYEMAGIKMPAGEARQGNPFIASIL